MNQICVTVLNSTFSKLQTQLMKRFQDIKKVMPRRYVNVHDVVGSFTFDFNTILHSF